MAAEMILSIECITCVYERTFAGPEDRTCDRLNISRTRMRPRYGGPGLLREQFSSIFLQLTVQLFDTGHFFLKKRCFKKKKNRR